MSGASWFVVSCGVRLSVVGSLEIRKPQVVRSIRIAGSIFSGAYKSLVSSNLHAFNVSQCPWDVGYFA